MKILRILIAFVWLLPATAFAFGLPGADPYIPNVVECMAGPGDVDVTSFGDVLTYHIKGTCKVNPVHVKGAWVPAGTYDVVATWRASDGAFHEKLHGPQSIGDNALEPQHGPWEMELSGNCKLDPFMTGADSSSCSGHVISSSNAIFKFSDKNFPVSPRVIPAAARAALTGKTLAAIEAEHQAPKILKPEEGKTYAGAKIEISIEAGKDSPTKSFKLEWQARSTDGQAWTPEPVLPETGPSGNVSTASLASLYDTLSVKPISWRVRARASQSSKAAWSDWRTFSVKSESKCVTSGPYAATYGASATPSSMTVGQATTVPITVLNQGSKTWTIAGNFHLSYHWVQSGNLVVPDGQRTILPFDIVPCQGTTLQAKLLAPPAPGTYTLEWDMVEDGVTWFSVKGVPTANRTVTVASSAVPPPPPAKK